MTNDTDESPRTTLVERLRFRGAASVGERGQIAVPADLRRELDIAPGEKLLVFRLDGEDAAVVLTAKGIASLLHGAEAPELQRIFSDLLAGRAKKQEIVK